MGGVQLSDSSGEAFEPFEPGSSASHGPKAEGLTECGWDGRGP